MIPTNWKLKTPKEVREYLSYLLFDGESSLIESSDGNRIAIKDASDDEVLASLKYHAKCLASPYGE